MLLPVVPKYLDLQASFMYGRGIGRYGSGQLPDVTIATDGSLAPITALHALAGFVLHPAEGLDVYGYAGIERANAKFFDLLGEMVHIDDDFRNAKVAQSVYRNFQ